MNYPVKIKLHKDNLGSWFVMVKPLRL